MSIEAILGRERVVPVLAFSSVEEAVAVSTVLVESGIRLLEITLRSAAALDCVRAVAASLPQACVGVGTVLEPAQIPQARRAGACFGVSPGLTPALARALGAHDFPFLPGAATVSEILAARELGFRILKFFPAESSGGTAFLRSLQDVVPDVTFCATGGLNPHNAIEYLGLRNVRAIGGSWMIRRQADGAVDIEATRAATEACVRQFAQ